MCVCCDACCALSVLVALVVCVGYMYVLWCLESTLCCQFLLHLAYVLFFVVLGAHLVLSVLAALGICVMFCGAWSAPGAVSACCTRHMCYVLCCLECTWCCQCLLHLACVLAICMCCGAWSAPGAVSSCCTWHMCWLYVVLGAHLCVGYKYSGVLGAHLVEEESGPCKIPNFSHVLGITGHICIL